VVRRQFLQTAAAGAIGLSIPKRCPGQSPEPGTFTYKTAAGGPTSTALPTALSGPP